MAQKQGSGKKAWTTTRKASNANADMSRKTRKEARSAVQSAAAKTNKAAGTSPWAIQKEKRATARRTKVRA